MNYDSIFNTAKKHNGVYINIECPKCKHKEAFFNPEKGYDIICNRLNNCGAHTHLKDFAPEFWESSIKKDPSLYYRNRGISKTIPNYKVKENYIYRYLDNNELYARKIYGNGTKTKFAYDSNPSQTFYKAEANQKYDCLYMVEGDIDADSFRECGYNAVAYLSANYDISNNKNLLNYMFKYNRVVLFVDNDNAGINFLKKHKPFLIQQLKSKIEFAICFGAKDANDLLIKNKLNDIYIQKSIEQAKIVDAPTPVDVMDIYLSLGIKRKIFSFYGKLYFGSVTIKNDEELPVTTHVLNGNLKILGIARDDTFETINYIFEHNNNQFAIEANNIASIAKFKEALLSKTGELYFMNNAISHNYFIDLLKKNAPEIEDINVIGRYKDVFVTSEKIVKDNKIYYKKKEREILKIDSKYYFTNIKMPCSKGSNILEKDQLIKHIYRIFGIKGLVVLSYYVSTLYAEQFFERYGFFPILNIFGSPNSGKSTLIKLLNNSLGIDQEGITIAASTTKGVYREISRRKSFPCCIIETNTGTFNPDALKAAYNWENLYRVANRSQDNSTRSFEFRSGLIFCQNDIPFKDAAEFQRLINIRFDVYNEAQESYNILQNSKDSLLPLINYNKDYTYLFNEQPKYIESNNRRNNILWCVVWGAKIIGIDNERIKELETFLVKNDQVNSAENLQADLVLINNILSDLYEDQKDPSVVKYYDVFVKVDEYNDIMYLNVSDLAQYIDKERIARDLSRKEIKKILTDNNYIVDDKVLRTENNSSKRCIGINLKKIIYPN